MGGVGRVISKHLAGDRECYVDGGHHVWQRKGESEEEEEDEEECVSCLALICKGTHVKYTCPLSLAMRNIDKCEVRCMP